MSSSDVRAAYDRWAAQYDSDENATRDSNDRILREQLQPAPDEAILEIGCGTGRNTEWLAERTEHATAVDLSEAMLDAARDRLDRHSVQLRQMDARKRWPFRNSRFDMVVVTLVLEHVEDVGGIFREARRVLRGDGHLYVAELHPYRQLKGTRANFRDEKTGEQVEVPSCLHSVSDFVNGGVSAGFTVREMGEWTAPNDDTARLLSVLYQVDASKPE